uniref:Uncharacterized protein n=1 Tax=Knipowitschia caucasica TaxID=637954 RepID=A0AAV2LUA0_KNICA
MCQPPPTWWLPELSAHFSTLKLPVVPADLSCTEELQTWHRPRTQGIKPEAVSEMIVSKPRLKKATKAVVKSTLYPAHSGPLPDQHLMTIEPTGDRSVIYSHRGTDQGAVKQPSVV